jgi:hypothetical protein
MRIIPPRSEEIDSNVMISSLILDDLITFDAICELGNSPIKALVKAGALVVVVADKET